MRLELLAKRAAGWSLLVFLQIQTAFSQVGDPLRGQENRFNLAQAWAPVLFQDESPEFTQSTTSFNPVDSIVALFFDGNEDLRDNGQTVFRLADDQALEALTKPVIYFSVLESESHFYINYMIYHALDAGPKGHAHDTENIWMILEKDGSPYGRLLMQVTNAHGYPMIYGPQLEEQWKWRLRSGNKPLKRFLPYLDRYSQEHHDNGAVEYVNRGDSQSMKVFVATKSHAIYKFNSKAWASSDIAGRIYYPETCRECADDVFKYRGQLTAYRLADWDSWMQEKMNAVKNGDIEADYFLKIFAPFKPERSVATAGYKIRSIPRAFVPGFGEERPAATIYYDSSLGTPYDLVLPASVHRYFVNQKWSLSSRYVYNPYLVDPVADEANRKLNRLRTEQTSSVFSFVTDMFQ